MRSNSLLAIAALTLAACSSGPSKGDAGSSSSSAVIGSSGGSVSTSDGTAVTIPAGGLQANASITITPAPNAPTPSNTTIVGAAYTLGPEGQQFAMPVTITLPFSSSKLPAGSTVENVVIFTAPVGSATYTALATTMADATHVRAQTTHFSVFVAAVPGAMPDAGTSVDGGMTDAGAADAGGHTVGPINGAWVLTGKNCNGANLDISMWPTTVMTIMNTTGQVVNRFCTIPMTLSYPSPSEVDWNYGASSSSSCNSSGDLYSWAWAISGNTLTLTTALTPPDEYDCGSSREVGTFQRQGTGGSADGGTATDAGGNDAGRTDAGTSDAGPTTVNSFAGTWTTTTVDITLMSQACGTTISTTGNPQSFLTSIVLTEDNSGNITGIDSNNGSWSGAVIGSTSAPTGFQLSFSSAGGTCGGIPGGSYGPAISCTATDPTTCTASGLDCQSCSALGSGNSASATTTGTLILTR